MTKQEKINEILWKACDTFRGVINSDQYKDYILVMLFIKYLSDVYKEHLDEYTKKYDGDQQRIQRAMQREKFVLDEKSTFNYLYQNRNAANIGEIINKALTRIEEENKTKLTGVFRNIDFNSESVLGKTKERNAMLKNLLDDFNNPELDLRPSMLGKQDIIGNSYEYMIARFASDAGKKGGEFFTPSEVSEVIARLVKPQSGDRIYDPACGSGSLLIKAANKIKDKNFQVYGQERNGSTHSLCKMNMFLHEIDDARIEWGDTLANPLHIENNKLMKFDVVVANPPFSLDKWASGFTSGNDKDVDFEASMDKYNRFWRGVPPKSKGDYAFVTHMIESMNETARFGIVLPHGVLFRGGSEEKIRKALIEENLLDAVIGLPENLFYGTGIPATVLIFKKNRKKKDILFIDASNDYEKGKNQNKLRLEDIEKIEDIYNKYKTVEKYSYVATIDEIRENEFNLNIPRYVDTFEEEEPVDMDAVKENIEKIEEELKDVKAQMNKYLKELGL